MPLLPQGCLVGPLIVQTRKEYYRNKIFNSTIRSKTAWKVISDLSKNNKEQDNFSIKHR